MNQRPEIRRGTMIQWLTGDSYFFAEPQEVREIFEVEEGTFVLVEGSDTGIPIDQVIDVEWEAKMKEERKKMKVLIFGAPGAGKGTAAGWLSQQFGVEHISTGDIIREHVEKQTGLGEEAEMFLRKGQLVPDELMFDLVASALEDKEGYILDGYPRTVPQAEALLQSMMPDAVIYLNVSEEVAIKRLLGRGRKDDVDDTIKDRLVVYQKQTLPVLEYLGTFSGFRISEIDGSGTIEETRKKIGSAITEPVATE